MKKVVMKKMDTKKMDNRNEMSVSRGALLELRRERELIEQGHRFLDEKRIHLARELLLRIETWQALLDELGNAETEAKQSLVEAVASYGILDLQAHPTAKIAKVDWSGTDLRFLGLTLPAKTLAVTLDGTEQKPSVKRPLAEETAQRYARVVEIAAEGAAMLTSMLRLEAEYKRTERSVRALENVVMPEIFEQQKNTEDALAELEQEEAVRVRLFAKRNKET